MSPFAERKIRTQQRSLELVQVGHNFGDSRIYFSIFYFNDFDVRLACPLGRLGASRPPAAEGGIPEETHLRSNLRNSSLRCQVSDSPNQFN
jgi:hypothetical protein